MLTAFRYSYNHPRGRRDARRPVEDLVRDTRPGLKNAALKSCTADDDDFGIPPQYICFFDSLCLTLERVRTYLAVCSYRLKISSSFRCASYLTIFVLLL